MAKAAEQKRTARKKGTPIPNKLVIRGGKALRGNVTVRGAKNSIPKCMVAAFLTREPCILHNVTDIEDVKIVSGMIRAMGGKILQLKPGSLRIETDSIRPIHPRQLEQIAGKSRIPILFAGPLLARFGTVMVPQLGGCDIGSRPVDFHIAALQQMGAAASKISKGFHITARKLCGTRVRLPYPSVGATEQVILTAVRAEGITELSNAAVEPEIIDLISLLQKMGAIISVSTNRVITITGVRELGGYEHTAISDGIEAASWACAALATNGKIFVRNARQLDMATFLNAFGQIGGKFTVHDDGITFWRGKELKSTAIETDVYPGFRTDWMQPFVIALTQTKGASIVHETVYEERFGFTKALNAMGAQIQLYRECLGSNKRCRFGERNNYHSAVIMGPTPLHAIEIDIPDLRAGFSYVIAGLSAKGISTLNRIDIIGRGYENFTDKLEALGAEIIV